MYKSDLTYGVERDGQNHNFLKTSRLPIHKKMVSHMNERDSTMTSSTKGVELARGGEYAFITETPILQHFNNLQPCDTMLVGNLFQTKSYGFGLPKNSEYTNTLSVEILKVRNSIQCKWPRNGTQLLQLMGGGKGGRRGLQPPLPNQ